LIIFKRSFGMMTMGRGRFPPPWSVEETETR